MDSDTLYKAFLLILTTFVRYGIIAFCTVMLDHRFMTQSEAALLQNPIVYGASAIAIITVVLGVYIRLKSHFSTKVALMLSKNSTPEDVDQIVKDSSVKEIVTLSPDPLKL